MGSSTRDDDVEMWTVSETTTDQQEELLRDDSSELIDQTTNGHEDYLDVESSYDVRTNRLDKNAARKLISEIRLNGAIIFTPHCRSELSNDEMTTLDVMNVLRCGKVLSTPEWHEKAKAWRYRIETNKMVVIVEFASMAECRAITAWRRDTQ